MNTSNVSQPFSPEDEANPFASPQSTYAPPPKQGWERPFASGRLRARTAAGLLIASIVLHVVSIPVTWMFNSDPSSIASDELTGASLRLMIVGLLQVCVAIATVVAFCMWIHRAYRNLPALGATGLSYSPRWAVGYFFIPILNLFRPYQASKEIWQASDPVHTDLPWHRDATGARTGTAWKHAPVSALLGVWWGLWLISNFIDRASARLATKADTTGELAAANYTSITAEVAAIPAAIAAIAVIMAIDKRQETKARQMGLYDAPAI